MEEEAIQVDESGRYEWLKTIIFLGLLFIVGFLSIRVVGPILFADYVPGILGIDSSQPIIEREDGSVAKPEESDQPAEPEPATGAGESDTDTEMEPVTDQEEDEEAGSGGEDLAEGGESAGQLPLRVYVVQTGDTLTSIAEANGLSVAEILAVNELLNPHYLQLGQEILLP